MGGPCFASEERRIGVWERGADGVFAERVLAKPADNLAIAALDLAVPLAEISAGVTFEA